MKHAISALMLFLVCSSGTQAAGQAAQSCGLSRYAVLPITTLSDGRISVPVTMEGRKLAFMVDTGGASAAMRYELADEMSLKKRGTFRGLAGVAGTGTRSYILADSFSLGPLKGGGIPVYLMSTLGGLGEDGLLASDMLHRYDVELDFVRGEMSLFSQSHCPGNVVHWTRSGYVALPARISPQGHIIIPIMLDGKRIMASVDTGAHFSVVSLKAAGALGITEQSPELELRDTVGGKYKRYSYPFRAMDLGGVTVNNPRVTVAADGYLPEGTDMLLGMSTLRQLHIYIAYKEEKLYITPALAN